MNGRHRHPMDLLLVHVPKLQNFYDPMGSFILGNLIPMGLLSLADAAEKAGYRTRIYHLAYEMLFTPGFSLEGTVRNHRPCMVGLDLHWHYQTHDVLKTVKRIRSAAPGVKIVLGGMTASIHAQALLHRQPDVDFVIRGEGERPLCELLAAITDGVSPGRVSNLSWRDIDGEIKHNPITFVASSRELNRYDFARFDLMNNAKGYFRRLPHIVWLKDFPAAINYPVFTPGKMGGYIVPVARGCPVDCAYCGGGRTPAMDHSGRMNVSMRSVRIVCEELRRVHRFGIRDLYFAFDPYPASSWYPRLFKALRRTDLRFQAVFESFHLPTPALVDGFRKTFSNDGARGSIIIVSPETGDEDLRLKNRGYGYTNGELIAGLDRLEAAGVRFQVSYTLGLPGETEATLAATRKLWRQIDKRYSRLVKQTATIIDPDPSSPMETAPARYGIRCRARTLQDLDDLHGTSARSSYTGWAHLPIHHSCDTLVSKDRDPLTPERMGRLLAKEKCRHFCHYFGPLPVPYPFNRLTCMAAGLTFRGVDLLRRVLGRGV